MKEYELFGKWEMRYRYRRGIDDGLMHIHSLYPHRERVFDFPPGITKDSRIMIDGVKYYVKHLELDAAILLSIDHEWQVELKRCSTTLETRPASYR